MGFEYEVENSKIQIETRQIERGIAVMPLVLITTCLMYRNRFLVTSLDGWRARQCNRYRSSPWVFRTVYTNFRLDRERWFWSCHTDIRPKMSPKNGNFEFSWISRRDRVGFPNCLDLHMFYCETVSASNFQVLICSGSRASTWGSFIRFLAGPARIITLWALLLMYTCQGYTTILQV